VALNGLAISSWQTTNDNPETTIHSQQVLASHFIDFIVSNNGDHTHDTTPVEATITCQPTQSGEVAGCWDLLADWELNAQADGNGFGVDKAWQIRVDDTDELASSFIDTTTYSPASMIGYANPDALVGKFYSDENATVSVPKPSGPPNSDGPGTVDPGDVAVMRGPSAAGDMGSRAFINWVAPRDMTIAAHIELYSVGSCDPVDAHFLVRTGTGGPLNPEGEQTILIPGYNVAPVGRKYVAGHIAPFAVQAGWEVMLWVYSFHEDVDCGMAGISHLTVTELQ
jgi:hypothetical protein